MEKISSRFSYRFWVILGFVAIVFIWFLPWTFLTNDDEVMMWLVSGAYTGQPESFAVFIHPLLSWTFSKLYVLLPSVPWYPLAWFGAMYCSFVVLLKLIWKRQGSTFQRYLWSLFLFAFVTHFTFFLQFSIVAAMLTLAGLVARTFYKQNDFSFYKIYWTDLLIVSGFLVRFEVSFLMVFGGLVLGLIGKPKEAFLTLILPLAFLAISFALTEAWYYHQDLDAFVQSNRLRSKVFDDPALQLMKPVYEKNSPDLYHFSNGLIEYQKDELTIQKLEGWKETINENRWVLIQPKWLLTSFHALLKDQWFFVSLMLSFLLFSLIFIRKKALFGVLILLTISILLSPFYLLKIQIYSLLFLTYFGFCLSLPKKRAKSYQSILPVFVLLLSVGVLFHFYSFWKARVNVISAEVLDEKLIDLKDQGFEKIYLIGSGEILREYRYEKRLPFQFLGWYTFLDDFRGVTVPAKVAYVIDEKTYFGNQAYFNGMNPPISIMEDFILVTRR